MDESKTVLVLLNKEATRARLTFTHPYFLLIHGHKMFYCPYFAVARW